MSLNNVQRGYRVAFDRKAGNQFVVNRGDGSTRVLNSTDQGLYTSPLIYTDKQNEGVVLMKTVDGNKSMFPKSASS